MSDLRSNNILHPYQKRAITSMVHNNELGLFLDLGMGKTVISLIAIKRLLETRQIRRVLIVAPIRVIYNVWRQEAKLWDYTKDLSFSLIHGNDKLGGFNSKAQIHLTNYESMVWLAEQLRGRLSRKDFPYDMVIFDESSKLKSHKTKRFKKIKSLMKYFSRRYILTATPVPNHLLDIWAQWFLVDDGKMFGKAFTRFRKTYFYQASEYLWVAFPETKKQLTRALKDKVIVLRARDYIDMPEVIHNPIWVDMPSRWMKEYKQLEKEFFLEVQGEPIEAFNSASLSNKLRQYIQGALYYGPEEKRKTVLIHKVKLEALVDLVDSLDGHPAIVAMQFRFEYDFIKKKWPNAPVIAGGMYKNEAEILRILDKWNAKKIPLLFCHPASLSHGVNLQRGGSNIIWLGQTWSLEQFLQLNGRLDRQGQQNIVKVHHILLRDTIDVLMYKSRIGKEKTQESVKDELT